MSQKQEERVADIGLGPIDTEEGPVEAVQIGSVTPDPTSTSPSTSITEDAASTDAQEIQTSGESQPTVEAPQKQRRKSKGKKTNPAAR